MDNNMKKLKDLTTIEYRYDSEEERKNHVDMMELLGYKCDGQVRQSDDSLMLDKEREYYWFARFYKYN